VTLKCPSLGCSHRFAALLLKIAKRFNPAWRAESRWYWFFGVALPFVAFGVNELVRGYPFLPTEREPSRWRDLAYAPQAQEGLYPLLVWTFAAYVAWLYGKRASWIFVGLLGGALLGAATSALYLQTIPLCIVGLFVGVGIFGFAPYAMLATYLHSVVAYVRERRPDAPASHSALGVLGLTSLWGILAGSGVEFAIARMNELYRALPEPRPSGGDCYLVTVAARGDPRLTGAVPVRLRDGRSMLVSRQLRRFKAFEIVLMAVAPGFHRALRAVYDRVGPPLAARMGPRAATVLHLLFKPIEVAIALVLRALFRNPDALVNGTYRSS
jgi:hypothetical protein